MWIESHQELARHPKTRKLARTLGVGVPCAIGHLHLLWWWAVDYAPDGWLGRFTAEDIADAVLWDGDPQVLWDALLGARWLDAGAEGAEIHHWAEYAGRLIEQRRRDAERKRATRRTPAPDQPPSNGHPADIQRTADVTGHNSTGHNSTGENHTPSDATHPSPVGENRRPKRPSATVEFAPDEREVIDGVLAIIPQLEGSPQFWRKLLDRYVDLDLEAEFVKMADWLGRHRKRQCSAAFVLNWLAKAAEHVPVFDESTVLIPCAGCGLSNRPVARAGELCAWCQPKFAVSA